MPPSTRQTRATLANAPPGSRAPSSNHSDSRQRSERGGRSGSPFDFMAKVPSPVVTTPTTPEVGAAAPAVAVHCNPLSAQPNSSYAFPISQAPPQVLPPPQAPLQAPPDAPEIEEVQRPSAELMPVCIPLVILTPVLIFHKPPPDPPVRGQHIAHIDRDSPVQVSDHLPR